MKRIVKLFSMVTMVLVMATSCAQNTDKTDKKEEVVLKKEATVEMNQDTLVNRVIREINADIEAKKSEILPEALPVMRETQSFVKYLSEGNKEKAVKEGKNLIGGLEVLLTKNPDAAFIPIDITYEKNELVADMETVKETVKAADEAMDEGYYQAASDLLQNLKSELVISTYTIPMATYPDAIKLATALAEDNKLDSAQMIVNAALGTIVVDKIIQPLPVLYAEQMIIEAASIDAKDHNNAEKVINLLKNADYQLKLAEAMGYGKKDKEFKTLAKAIKELEKSVNKKEESQSKFDSLKKEIKSFKKRLFPVK